MDLLHETRSIKRLGQFNVSRTSDTDSDDEGATRQKKKKPTPKVVKRLRAAPGWEDWTEGKQLRRALLSDYEEEENEDN